MSVNSAVGAAPLPPSPVESPPVPDALVEASPPLPPSPVEGGAPPVPDVALVVGSVAPVEVVLLVLGVPAPEVTLVLSPVVLLVLGEPFSSPSEQFSTANGSPVRTRH